MDSNGTASFIFDCFFERFKWFKMVNMHKKIWAHYELLIQIMSIYITLFFGVPVEAVLSSLRSHAREIESGVKYAVKTGILIGLKWAAIILPISAVFFYPVSLLQRYR